MRSAVLDFELLAGVFPESITLLVWDTKAHCMVCEQTTPIMLIVVELVEQLICHMARFVMQFSGHNIARELSRWCYCICVGINTTLRGRCVKIG